MKSRIFLATMVVFTVIAFTAVPVFGQAVNYAQIQGRITDQSGAVVPRAQVKATQTATGLVRTTSSNAEGEYFLPNLPVGRYQLRVSMNGFRDHVQEGIVLQVGETPRIDIKLQVGSVSEVVQVEADAGMLETRQNSISTVIDNSRIMELPLNGRNAPDLIMYSGAATNPTLTSNDLMSSKNYGNGTSGASQTVSVAGSQENANNFLLDGSDNNDAFSNVNSPFPFPDAIQEFSVQKSGLSARYGVHAGAVVNVVTKSGANNFHGDIFEFFRNPIFNAHHVNFTPPAPGFKDDTMKRNQFGGTVGGPIIKDKLLFFVGYQGTRQASTPPPISVKVPTAAAIAGDFSTMMSAACQSTGKAKALKAPFVNNKVDPSQFNAPALALLKYIPVATDPCGNLSFTVPGTLNEDQVVGKMDWNVSAKHTLFTRYFFTDYRAPVPFVSSNILPQGQTASQLSRFQSMAFGDTYMLTPNMVNSLHLTATRLAIHRGPASDMINPTTVGINVPSPVAQGLVLGVSSGYFTTGGGSQMPGFFINNLFQVADDVDMTLGKHQLSFGVNYMRMQLNYLSTFQSNGQFTFGGNLSGDNLADYMLGWPSTFAQGNPEAENWRYTYFGLYLHDNFRVRPNLSLNVGIRWEPFLPSKDAFNRGSHFDYAAFMAGTHSTVFPNAPAGLFFCGDAGIPCSFQNSKWLQFSPRFGLVWDPTNQGKLTIRAGYGIFYDSPEMYYFDRYADNSPYGSGISFAPKTTSGASLTNPYIGQPGTVPQFPLPFPVAGSPNAYFPLNGVYINNSLDVHPMYAQNWNLTIEKQLGANWMLSASYLGSKTTHIWAGYEANPGMNVSVPSNALSGCTPGQAASTSNTNCRRTLYLANPSQGQYFSNLTTLWDGANAEYNAMLLNARHRFSNNFTVLANYTWSHCISDQDFSGELTNSRPTMYPSPVNNPNTGNLKLDRGNCGFDVRQSLNASMVISSPKYDGKLSGAFLNNWQFAPLFSYRTGTYFTVLTGVDTSLQGSTTSYKDRPNQVSDPLQGGCTISGATVPVHTTQCWFNTAAFVAPATGTFGTVGRDSLQGPHALRFDVAVSRRFRVLESREVQLRMEVFNLFNHPVFGNPVTSLNSSSFGKIQSQSGDGRTFQFAFKFNF
jgi:hypothetical protein